LTFEDIVRRQRPPAEALDRRAELARIEREIAGTASWLSDAPSLETEAGARRIESGSTGPDVNVHVAFPLLSDRASRGPAVRTLSEASVVVVSGDLVEARLRLRRAFLDGWLAQEIVAVRRDQVAALERILEVIRRRIAAGANAPYEESLFEGELLRARSETDSALALRGEAWSDLRALAELPPSPVALADPGRPDPAGASRALESLEGGALERSVAGRRDLALAVTELERSRLRSRWSVGGGVGSEGEERFATLSAGYRFALRGERDAVERERTAREEAARRSGAAETDALVTRALAVRERAETFGDVPDPAAFDAALRAVLLRVESGKDLPTEGLLLRRQLLEAKDAAFERVRSAHLLVAEIEALASRGVEP
jgi:hypothetical protein